MVVCGPRAPVMEVRFLPPRQEYIYMNGTYQRFIIALLVLVAGWLVFQSPTTTVYVGEAMVIVKVADTPSELQQGLSGRASLAENEGMHFVFQEPGNYSFWMKDMNFAIDIIWISADQMVVGITENVQPDSFPETFTPLEEIQYALEVQAGWAERNSVQAGDDVYLGL